MTPDEAYRHISIIIDEMNVALSSYITSDIQIKKNERAEEADTPEVNQQTTDEEKIESQNDFELVKISTISCL